MDYNQLLEDLKSAESERAECKTSFREDDFGKTMASFSTRKGGKIYLGVNESREPVGLIQSNTLNDEIEQVARVVNPPAAIGIEVIPHDSQKVIVCVTVHKGNGIYSYKNVPYERREGINHPLQPDEIVEIQKNCKKLHFDEMPSISGQRPAIISDIDENKVKKFIEISKGKILEKIDMKQFLINYDLLVDGYTKVRNVAVLLFGKNPTQFIPQNKISISIFPSDEITQNFVKNEINGDIQDIINRTFVEIEKNTRTFSIVDGLRRIDAKEYPQEALREAVINAIAHRDYFSDTTEIFIKFFKSKIEIANPGGFPYNNYTFDEIEKSGLSIRRNPLLAKMLEYLNFMEQEGRGIRMIKELVRQHGLPDPKIEVTQNTFKITFFGVGEDTSKIMNSPFNRIIDLKGLNERQRKAIEYLKENRGQITNRKYREIFGVNNVTAFRDLSQLVMLGILKQHGWTRGSYYVLNM